MRRLTSQFPRLRLASEKGCIFEGDIFSRHKKLIWKGMQVSAQALNKITWAPAGDKIAVGTSTTDESGGVLKVYWG